MSHAHTHPGPQAGVSRQVRLLLAGCVALIAAAVAVGMIVLWPGELSSHLDRTLTAQAGRGASSATARIDRVEAASCRGVAGSTQTTAAGTQCGRVSFTLLDGAAKGGGGTVLVPRTTMQAGLRSGQHIVVSAVPAPGGTTAYQFVDVERTWPMLALAGVFVAVIVAVARWRGLLSVVGLGIAGAVLLGFVFPALVAGKNAVGVGIVGCIAIMLVVLYTAHGVSARSTTALLGTIAGIVLCAALSVLFTRLTGLSGVVDEDSMLLAASAPDLNLSAALMCGIMIAGLGVLNDVTITQASAVWELADGGHDATTLYRKAMRIGRDHIASTVYTIAFATAGAGLTTFLLIVVYQRPLGQLLTAELFAEEIVRTLVGSIGLALAVPLTTLLGVAVVRSARRA